MIRYYVMQSANRFEVRREGRLKGTHVIEARALQAAKFMASVEAAKLGERTLVILETLPGRLERVAMFTPEDPIALPPGAIRVGDDVVAALSTAAA